MTTQPNQGFTFAAPATIQIRRRPCLLPADVATHQGRRLLGRRRCRSGNDVQAIANECGREPDRRKLIAGIKRSKHWRDVGALKRELIEMWIAERNAFAERVVKDIRAQGAAARLE